MKPKPAVRRPLHAIPRSVATRSARDQVFLLEGELVRVLERASAAEERSSDLERELRHAAAAPSPPAFPQIVTESPGSIISICTPAGASSCSFCGVPVSSGKVPQWHGTHRLVPSSSSATAASRGPMV